MAVMAQAAEQLVALELVPLQKAEGEEGRGIVDQRSFLLKNR